MLQVASATPTNSQLSADTMLMSCEMKEGLQPPASSKLLKVNTISVEQNDAEIYPPLGKEHLAGDTISRITFHDRHWPCGDRVHQENVLPVSTLFMFNILILLQSRSAGLLLFTAVQF